MSQERLKLVLGVVASLILYGGLGAGLLVFIFGLAVQLGAVPASAAYWRVGAFAGLIIGLQALVLGGALKLLISIDDRLQRIERRT